ncbi:MAG: hypothetical protein KatS3mg102_1016 [Planctomycetota bacterium]|nr:MAG: hypothetical protein KatS3mg102_1016 [Planctomycetota bacterium]
MSARCGRTIAAAPLALAGLAAVLGGLAPTAAQPRPAGRPAPRAAPSTLPPLAVGFGRASLVTALPGITLGGYGGRGLVPHLGVHDATWVKAMVVRTPERALAIVTLDLIGVQRTLLEALRARGLPPRVELEVDDILICASHTHAGYGSLAQRTGAPALDALFFLTCGRFRPDFFAEVVGKIHRAIVQAWDDLAPAAIGVGAAEVPGLARNRGCPGGPVDPELGVIKVTSPDGRLRGLVVNFAAHPTVLGAEVLHLSAGYPGALQRALEARHPGTTVLFTQGAAGDLSVRVPPGRYPDVWARMEATGQRLAEHVERIQAAVSTSAAVRIASRGIEADFPVPRELYHRLRALGGLRRSLFQQVVLGEVLLMGVPGEPCCRIGLELKAAARRRGFRHAFVVGLAQDHAGYFVHAEDYAPEHAAHHTYEKRLNFAGPEVGAFLLEVHLERLGPRPLPAAPPAPAGAR